MCGIFAYSGPRPLAGALLDGLQKLEYRGYDSSGMAFFHKKNKVKRARVKGDISSLRKILKKTEGRGVGIGHTRWATHGAVTAANAHPHKSGPVYIVHNGALENVKSLRQRFQNSLQSDTDSELIAHLIRFHLQKLPFPQAVLKAAKDLKGSYAVVALNENAPGELAALKNGPPLLLCRGGGEWFVTSDARAAPPHAKEALFLEDGEMLHLQGKSFQLFNSEGGVLKRGFLKLPPAQKTDARLSKRFPHWMLKEILDQAPVTEKIVRQYIRKERTAPMKEPLKSLFQKAKELVIVASGSSFHAALYGRYVFENIMRLKTRPELASEWILRNPVVSKDALFLFISQSGETADTLNALKWAKAKGLSVVSLCNTPYSSMERLSISNISMQAGEEAAVAATKSFTASLLILNLLALQGAKAAGRLSKMREKAFARALSKLPRQIEKILRQKKPLREWAEKLKDLKGVVFIGKGPYYPLALEGALKLKELAYISAEGLSAGEMKHGPLALLDKRRAAAALLPPMNDPLYEKMEINLQEARSRGASVFTIGSGGPGGSGGGGSREKSMRHPSADFSKKGSRPPHLSPPAAQRRRAAGGKNTGPPAGGLFAFSEIPDSDPLLHPILSSVPLQLLAYWTALSLKLPVDRPRNLAKSVTVE